MCTMPAFHMGISQPQGATMQKRPGAGFMRLLRSKAHTYKIVKSAAIPRCSQAILSSDSTTLVPSHKGVSVERPCP